jgi:hypothetical protein
MLRKGKELIKRDTHDRYCQGSKSKEGLRRTWKRTIEEDALKEGKNTEKKLKNWLRTGSVGGTLWMPCASPRSTRDNK